MQFRTASSPHLPVAPSVHALMRQVIYALLPGIAVAAWFFGWGILVNLLVACVAGLLTETAMLKLRGRPVARFTTDGSVLITAMLLSLAIPPLAPWWLTAFGTAFAVIFGKHLYGGLGYNPFNPAMLGYVALLISFPTEMTSWLPARTLAEAPPSLLTVLSFTFLGDLPAGVLHDALTGATPLDYTRTHLAQGHTLLESRESTAVWALGGPGWTWMSLAFLAGGLWMLWKGTIRWQIPAGLLGMLGLLALVFWAIDPDRFASPAFHWFSGASMIGAFFIATDPISASTTPRGRLVYGALIGLLTYVIRTWGGYADAIAFSVLLANLCVPLIDQYTQPRVYGSRRQP